MEYLVKWWSYPESDNTWEPERNCTDTSSASSVRDFESKQLQWSRQEVDALYGMVQTRDISQVDWEEIAEGLAAGGAAAPAGETRSANACELEAWSKRHEPTWQGVNWGDDEDTTEDEDSGRAAAASSGAAWSAAEDAKLRKLVGKEGTGAWAAKAEKFDNRSESAVESRWTKVLQGQGVPETKGKRKGGAGKAAAKKKKPRPAPAPAPVPVGFRVVTQWSQIRPECERLSQTVITDDAKELLSKKVKQLSGVPSGARRSPVDAAQLWWQSKHHEDRISAPPVLAVLDDPSLMQEKVGVGAITDTNHPCMRESIDAGRSEHPVYLAFAKQALGPNVVLGEYTGRIRSDADVQADEEEREAGSDDPADAIPMAYNYTFDRTSKWDRGESLLTVDAFTCGNELRFINDYRDDLENFAEIERQRRRSNVEAMEVWRNGRPHIILVTRTAVAAMEELLVDYGDEYWARFLKQHRAARRLRSLMDGKLAAEQRADKAESELKGERQRRQELEAQLEEAKRQLGQQGEPVFVAKRTEPAAKQEPSSL